MNNQYIEMIKAINVGIHAFNRHLSSVHRVPTFDLRRVDDKTYVSRVVHKDWDAFKWINPEDRRVYFIFGHDANKKSEKGLYVGKASYSSTIGRRLWVHFNRHRYDDYFEMNNATGRPYRLQYSTSISLDKVGLGFMASALEEFLLGALKNKLHLLNGTG